MRTLMWKVFTAQFVFFLVKIIKKGPSSRKGIRSGSFYTKSQRRDNEASKRNCDYYKAARRNVKLPRAIPDYLVVQFLLIKFKAIHTHKKCHYLISEFSCASLVQNPSYENKFDLHENKPVGGTHFHMKGFARGKRQFRNGLI